MVQLYMISQIHVEREAHMNKESGFVTQTAFSVAVRSNNILTLLSQTSALSIVTLNSS